MTASTPQQLQLFGTREPATAPPPDAVPVKAPPQAPDGAALRRRLDLLLPAGVASVALTDNRSRIFSARQHPDGRLAVRIHRCFVLAGDPTLRAVAELLSSRRRGKRRDQRLAAVRDHFQRHAERRDEAPRRRTLVLRPVGRCFDLRQLRDEVNARYFGGTLEVHITWGRAPSHRRRGRCFSIRLGSYDERQNLVRVHPSLDRAEVPRYVVESVVHHELLHAAMPPATVNGRRRLHPPEFRRRERLFEHYRKAERWIEKHLTQLARNR